MEQIHLGKMVVDVELKNIKNIHLSVYPPTGRVRIAAPLRFDLETIRMYAISRLGWIKKQQVKLRKQPRESARVYKSRESHYFMGRRYLLKVEKTAGKPAVFIRHDQLIMQVKPDSSAEQKQILLQEWYREQLKNLVPQYISQWEKTMRVKVSAFGIKRMKTCWGTCNAEAGRIWINLELAKKPRECLEYIIVHEMVHLLERRHNARFVGFMDRYLPQWREYQEELNRLPVSHAEWKY